MATYCQPRLEFSPDPLSVTSPVYQDVTSYVISASWGNGQQRELDDPQAGQAVFVLKNLHRDFEPEYAGGRFAGNIVPLRRFRWTIIADGVSHPQGVWYATSFQVDYPDRGAAYSTVTVTCTDGFALLSLATLPQLVPPIAESYGDVVDADQPIYHWPLDELNGRRMSATGGGEGQYKGAVTLNQPNPVLGEATGAVTFASGFNYGRVVPDDVAVWHDSAQLTMEAVTTYGGTGAHGIVAGPAETGSFGSPPTFQLVINASNQLEATVSTSGVSNADAKAALSAGSHHVAATYDGGVLRLYIDGVQVATDSNANNVVNPASGGVILVGGQSSGLAIATTTLTVSHVAVYDYALSSVQVATHAAAATSRGYPQATAGSRIAALATNALWSTAAIPAGQITVTPRMQHGQPVIDEIVEAVRAEHPIGLFYFNDVGNPAYAAWEYDTTIQTILGDTAGEVPYDDLALVYDDEVYNTSTVSRDGGDGQTASDTASITQYGARGQDESSLIVAFDADAQLIAQTIVDRFGRPMQRFENVTLNGSDARARTQILAREIGDTIRIKRRGEGGTAIDVVTPILAKQKTLDVHGDLRCTWTLARGFPGAAQVWRIGQAGYSELGVTTILG